jgi:hypothetical protein
MGPSRWCLLAFGATTTFCVAAAGIAGAGGPGEGHGARPVLKNAATHTAASGATTQPLKELQDRFDREDNSVRKAKLIQKLGDAQFEALHAAERAEDYARYTRTGELRKLTKRCWRHRTNLNRRWSWYERT